jgi:two-component system chemotaxis response regulator CheB
MSCSATVSDAHGPATARVLIVDDSVVARGLFSRWVAENPRLSVAGVAADGMNAVRSAARLQPDIIILDLDMPVMDGLTALPEILKASPASSVVVASSLTARSARLSMQCLSLGAVDLQPKPESNRDLTMSLSFREELMRKLDGLIGANPEAQPQRPAPGAGTSRPIELPRREPPRAEPREAVATLRLDLMPRLLLIGASTGGPRAVTRLLADLAEAAARMPVIVVQHMPAVFTASFAEQLQSRLGRPVREAAHGELLAAGGIYVAPGGRHLRLEKADGQPRLLIEDSPPVKFCRPSIDVLFNDAAHVFGASALGIILTGMGSDGLEGARRLRTAGARIVAQDEASSVVWGMPGAVVREGVANCVLPIQSMGGVIAAALQACTRA